MRNSIVVRLDKIEKTRKVLPRAIVQFADGHRERLDLHQIAVAFFERNKAGIVSLEWERPNDAAVVFKLLACPELWARLSRKTPE